MLLQSLEAFVAILNALCFWHWLSGLYLLLILFERYKTNAKQGRPYDTKDALCSLAIGAIGTGVQFTFSLLIPLSIYTYVFNEFRLVNLDNIVVCLLVAFVVHDFIHYWVHRLGHQVGLLWSFHAIHHSSNAFNHTTAMRLFPLDGRLKIMSGVFAAMIGVSPEIYLAVALLKSMYSIWTHASYVGDLGWIEKAFITPRLHMVHHARQPEYLDKNYGQVLLLWDRMFGTYQPYTEPPVAGLVTPVHDNNPITAQFVGIRALAVKIRSTQSWNDRVSYFTRSPSWNHRHLEQKSGAD